MALAQRCSAAGLQVPRVYRVFESNRSGLDWPLDQQIVWHQAAVQSQMEQLYYGLAIAVALNRTIILPQVRQGLSWSPRICTGLLCRPR